MIAKATIKTTGEVIEYEVTDLSSLMTAYTAAQDYEKASKTLKDQLKKELEKHLDEHGRSIELNGKQFKSIRIQRMNYDKAVLREVLDEDTFDLFMKPAKGDIDKFIAEHLDELGELSTRLRNSMVDDGNPYTQVKLEKLKRD